MTFTQQPIRNRHLPLEGLYNLRDLGGYVTQNGHTRWRKLFRADSPHELTLAAQTALLEQGLNLVIDLRNADELAQSPNVFAEHQNVQYINVPLFSGLKHGSPTSPDSQTGSMLERMYKSAFEHCQAEFRTVIEEIANNHQGVTLFHCTAGKDRTGLIAALLLGAMGVSQEQIIEDYALTTEYVQPLLETLREDAVRKGHDLDWYNQLLSSEPQTMRGALGYLEREYAGATGYLERLGLSGAVLKLQTLVTAQTDQSV